VWLGQTEYEFFDYMDVDDVEWERYVMTPPLLGSTWPRLMSSMKQTGEQYDDRIVEVCWDTEQDTWRIMRIRDDKPAGNHKSIVNKILVSIRDGVEIEAVSLALVKHSSVLEPERWLTSSYLPTRIEYEALGSHA
jgi:mRNA guanylyltransferase